VGSKLGFKPEHLVCTEGWARNTGLFCLSI